MKFGLLVYKDTLNIGDDVQSYTALRFLPKVDYIIDRDEIDSFVPDTKEDVAVIMNGWFMTKKYSWPPSPYILPHLTSMHFSEYDSTGDIGLDYLDDKFATDYLKKFGKVGCRE